MRFAVIGRMLITLKSRTNIELNELVELEHDPIKDRLVESEETQNSY
ncbi:MAG: hypothetical protein PHD13_03475 [Methanocellales archaeon]|nr:hypothetical protein [Methanocellales archaeon]MDD3291649.1 hypothetical protein [Methanocellales archaeon]MDD5235218.1 hypothetical protein [Methanocellales archaeon]MDD5485432.1 hypothetical protein [Methanocellales archaeon]